MKTKIALLMFSGCMAAFTLYAWKHKRKLAAQSVAILSQPDPKEELKKIYAHYVGDNKEFQLDGRIELLDQENGGKEKEHASFEIIRSGQGIYSRLSYLQTLVTKQFTLQVDSENHRGVLSPTSQQVWQQLNSPVLPVQDWINSTVSFSIHLMIEQQEGSSVLTLQNERTPELRSTKIYYDPRTYRLLQVDTEWWKENKAEQDSAKCWLSRIHYEYEGKPISDLEVLAKKYLSGKDSQLAPSPDYKNYEWQIIPATQSE